MYFCYKFILFISIFVSQIVSSAVIQEIFTSDFPDFNFEVVEVVKIHRDDSVPCGFVIDEVDYVFIDYSKPMPDIIASFDPSDEDKPIEVVETDKDLEL
jgi:hypothetical protein